MQIWPAIDIRGGKCVRLLQGDYGREKVFSENPVEMALRWTNQGAEQLHLVDLDAARDGKPTNLAAIEAIVSAVDVPCQLGGGIRNDESIDRLLGLGVRRLVVGTAALKDPDWFRHACRRQTGRLVLGIDARDGLVATDGWTETSGQAAEELARQFADEPLAAIVYTDIATDGMLGGPNTRALGSMASAVGIDVIASGGVTTAEDVARLATIPVAGCIIGMALYEGRLSLPDALAAAMAESQSSVSDQRMRGS
ncbi:MAG: 1-(5-phosphoribosyl)-5-[(5-phosphoribosylamino)methylideneamino]imidazole-4-carboxamide isomerase [Pirellulales bacterium]